jgi:hypothetical protein
VPCSVHPVSNDRGLKGVDVPYSLVPAVATSPVGAGQSTGRKPKRPSGAHQSRAREHPPSTQNPVSSALRMSPVDALTESQSVRNRQAANMRPTAPAAAGRCHVTSANPGPEHPPITPRLSTIPARPHAVNGGV